MKLLEGESYAPDWLTTIGGRGLSWWTYKDGYWVL